MNFLHLKSSLTVKPQSFIFSIFLITVVESITVWANIITQVLFSVYAFNLFYRYRHEDRVDTHRLLPLLLQGGHPTVITASLSSKPRGGGQFPGYYQWIGVRVIDTT